MIFEVLKLTSRVIIHLRKISDQQVNHYYWILFWSCIKTYRGKDCNVQNCSLSSVLYGMVVIIVKWCRYETWSYISGCGGSICGSEKGEVTGGWESCLIRNSFLLLVRYYWCEPIKEDDMEKAYGMHGRDVKCILVFNGKSWRKRPLRRHMPRWEGNIIISLEEKWW